MAAPYPLLMKKKKNNGVFTSVINTEISFGMVCSSIPFKFAGEAKDLPENDWYDEDGLDVYKPDEGIRLKSYEMEVEFLYKGSYNTFASSLNSFLEYLTGKDGQGSYLVIYDSYNNIGRQDVRFESISNDVFIKQGVSFGSGQEIARFKITFKVDDPVTNVILSVQ